MRCKKCMTLLWSLRVLEDSVAFVCEKCGTLAAHEVVRRRPAARRVPASV